MHVLVCMLHRIMDLHKQVLPTCTTLSKYPAITQSLRFQAVQEAAEKSPPPPPPPAPQRTKQNLLPFPCPKQQVVNRSCDCADAAGTTMLFCWMMFACSLMQLSSWGTADDHGR